MGIYNRLNINFDTAKFGNSQNLSNNASNTLNLIAETSGKLPEWQKSDLNSGINRSNYFKNPTTIHLNSMLSDLTELKNSALSANDFVLSDNTQNLIIEIGKFRSHTDNISGVVAVSNTYFPSLQSAQNIGQLNMLTLAKTEGVSNSTPILGSYTSLFIQDELISGENQIYYYANEYTNSIIRVTTVDSEGNTISILQSNLSNVEIGRINTYLETVNNLLYSRRTSDCTFYRNSIQLSQDVGFLQQFNNMGGTMSFLVNNIVGTDSLLSKLNSS